MSDTIALISDVAGQTPSPGQRVAGWSTFVETGAQQLIGELGQHFMMLHPDRLDDGGIDRLVSDPPYGIIALREVPQTDAGRALLAKLRARSIPMVVYGDDAGLAAYDRVASDHRAGSYEICKYLISRGCRRILRYWITPGATRPAWLGQRDAGYLDAMREAGLAALPPIEHLALPAARMHEEVHPLFELSTRTAVGYLLPYLTGAEPVDAIMAGSDGTTYSIAAAVRFLGKTPNRDVLMAGYDNYWTDSPERSMESSIPLVTADKQNMTIGRKLVELLNARLAGTLSQEPQRVLVKPELVLTPAATQTD